MIARIAVANSDAAGVNSTYVTRAIQAKVVADLALRNGRIRLVDEIVIAHLEVAIAGRVVGRREFEVEVSAVQCNLMRKLASSFAS